MPIKMSSLFPTMKKEIYFQSFLFNCNVCNGNKSSNIISVKKFLVVMDNCQDGQGVSDADQCRSIQMINCLSHMLLHQCQSNGLYPI